MQAENTLKELIKEQRPLSISALFKIKSELLYISSCSLLYSSPTVRKGWKILEQYGITI